MAEDDLHGLTVTELRSRCRDRSLPTAGKKSELLKRLSVMPTTLPVVEDEPEEATEEQLPVKKARKTSKRKTAIVVDLAEAEEEEEEAEKEEVKKPRKSTKRKAVTEEKEEEEAEGEQVAEVKKARKSTKKNSLKKAKKAKIVPDESLEEKEEEENGEDLLNTSNQTYDIVSPSSEAAAAAAPSPAAASSKKVATPTSSKKCPTPTRRPSECRRSIFKRLALDPVDFTPTKTLDKKRVSFARTPKSTAVRVEAEDTVEQMEEEEAEAPTVPPIEEEEEKDEEVMDEEEEEDEEAPPAAIEAIEEEAEQEEDEETHPLNSSTFSADGAAAEDEGGEAEAAANVSIMSELSTASAKSTKSRRSFVNAAEAAGAGTPTAPATIGGGATRPPRAALSTAEKQQLPPAAPRSAGGRMAPGERFKKAHKAIFDKQEFIGDTMAKKEERRAALLRGGTAGTQRLATPKNAATLRKPLREQPQLQLQKPKTQPQGFKFGSSAVPSSFQFGATAVEDIRTVQKRPSAIPAPSARLLVRKKIGGEEEKKLDAKARAKVMTRPVVKPQTPRPLTVPDDVSFVNRMATPRAQLSSASAAHRGAGGYTPRRGKVTHFVDTTKLSDREYQLAMEAGLLGGSKKTTTKKETDVERRNRTRDEIVNVKRKLNMA